MFKNATIIIHRSYLIYMSFNYCPYGHREDIKELSQKLWKTDDNYPITSFENIMTNGFVDAETQARWDEWIETLDEILNA